MKRIFNYVFVVVVTTILFFLVYQNRSSILSFKLDLSNPYLYLLILTLPVIFLTNIISWHLITKTLGMNINFNENFKIWTYSNAARLLPGGFWQYPGRIYLLAEHGVSKGTGSMAVLIEALCNLVAGGFLVLLVSNFWLPIYLSNLRWVVWVVCLLPLLLAFFLKTKPAKKVFNLIEKFTGKKMSLTNDLKLTKEYFLLILFFALQYVFAGLALFFLSNQFVSLASNLATIFIGVYTFSWLIGYLAFFAPGGLGVIEVSLSTLLSNFMPFGVAIAVSVIFRVFLLLTEVVFLICASFLLKFPLSKKAQTFADKAKF